MKDIKITTFRQNARNEISFKIVVKEGDYTIAEQELLKQAEINGNLLDIEITGLVNGDVEQHKKQALVKLNGLMLVYAEKAGVSMDVLKKELYTKYNIQSRAELNIEDIEREIESYKFGILEYN